MSEITGKNEQLMCEVAGPLRLREAEALCPALLTDGAYQNKDGLVTPVEQPDFPWLRGVMVRHASIRKRVEAQLAALDALRKEQGKAGGRSVEGLVEFAPGYARRALLRRDADSFNRMFSRISRVLSKEWRRWLEHVEFWETVLGAKWLGQESVPAGPARAELMNMLGLRYALLPQRFPNVLPETGLAPSVEIAVQLGQMQGQALKKPRPHPEEDTLRRGALAMLHGDWEEALGLFLKVFRASNTALYTISEGVHAPLLVYAYICAIRAGAKRQVIQTWGDVLQGILPAYCLAGESEGMVAFLHNLTLLDGIMNRRTMPAYVPDAEYDLACIPLALCYDRLSPKIRHKITGERIVAAIENVMAQGQLLLGYYAATAVSSVLPLPDGLRSKLAAISKRKTAPLYAPANRVDTMEQSPADELEYFLNPKGGGEIEMLHWEIQLDTASNMVKGMRPRLRASNEMAISHELTINQSATLCRVPQDLAAIQLAHMLEQGDAAALRWVSALAGHPRLRLVLGGRRTHPITLQTEKPVLRFQREGDALTVTMEAREDGVLRRVDDHVWAALQHSDLLESMREFFRARGENGVITLPESAADVLFAQYDKLVRCFDVQGTLSRAVAPVPGECILVAALHHGTEGLEIRLKIRIHSKADTLMGPGEGASHLDVKTPAGIIPIDRNLAQEKEAADALCRACRIRPDAQGYVWHPATHLEALELLAHMEEAGVALLQDDGSPFRCVPVQHDHVELHARYIGGDWFELGAELEVDEGLVYTLRELLQALENAEKNFLPVRNGFLRLEAALESQLKALKVLTGTNGRIFGISAAALPALAQSIGEDYLPREMRERLDKMGTATALPAPVGLQTQLRPYQLQGFRWLAERAAAGIGTCLADDMGLGKTVQLISLLLHRAPEGPSLVIAPLSLQANWQHELAMFAPSLRVKAFHTGQPWNLQQAGEVILASYGQVVSNLKDFSAIPWNVLALDEAQAIKNPDSQRAKAVCTLHATVRVALTGTPVENSTSDLQSLMHFLNPLLLGSKARFRRNFLSGDALYPLHKVVAPLILRRTKAEVLPQLPKLTEQVRYVELSDEERAVYESVRRNALQKLEDKEDRISILAELTRLRRACCHASLVLPEYAGPASKLEGMLDLVLSLRDAGHKVLIFSQFTNVLDLAEPLLQREGVTYERLDGNTPPRQRAAAVKRFQEGEATAFLISLKAGGTGLNLTAADYVLLLDPWWNPAVEAQAAGRSHRIGQDSPVTLYRFIATHTVEERVLAMHQEKKDLADAILSCATQISMESLHELLS